MRIKEKIILIIILLAFIIGINNKVYAVGRFVDIPVPPSNLEAENESEENNTENTEKKEEFVVKSSNNLLKKLEIEGYNLEPKFENQKNEYVVDLKNDGKGTTINIVAEAEDGKSKIQGNGKIEVQEGQELININVIAENGNLNVYTIKIQNTKNTAETSTQIQEDKKEIKEPEKQEKEQINNTQENKEVNSKNEERPKSSLYIYVIGVSVMILVILVIIKMKKNKKGKHV